MPHSAEGANTPRPWRPTRWIACSGGSLAKGLAFGKAAGPHCPPVAVNVLPTNAKSLLLAWPGKASTVKPAQPFSPTACAQRRLPQSQHSNSCTPPSPTQRCHRSTNCAQARWSSLTWSQKLYAAFLLHPLLAPPASECSTFGMHAPLEL